MRDGLAKGIREVIRAIELGESSVVLLAEDCNHAEYKKLVECMCAQNGVPLVKVQSKMDLGAMCGLVKLDTDGNPVKTRGCSSASLSLDSDMDISWIPANNIQDLLGPAEHVLLLRPHDQPHLLDRPPPLCCQVSSDVICLAVFPQCFPPRSQQRLLLH